MTYSGNSKYALEVQQYFLVDLRCLEVGSPNNQNRNLGGPEAVRAMRYQKMPSETAQDGASQVHRGGRVNATPQLQ